MLIRLASNSKKCLPLPPEIVNEVLGYQINVCFNNDKIRMDPLAQVFNPSTGGEIGGRGRTTGSP